MEKMIIKGGQRLSGEVSLDGSRKATLYMQAAAILASNDTVSLANVSEGTDIEAFNQVLHSLKIQVDFDHQQHLMRLKPSENLSSAALAEHTNKIRDVMLLLGPLLARLGFVKIAVPSDTPSLAPYLKAFGQLGAVIEQHHDYLETTAEQLVGNQITLDLPDAGVTAALMMAATMAQGITTIENAACEPEMVDLASMLNKMGARVHGAGTTTIRIQGVDFLHGCEYSVMVDRIEAGNFMIAAAVTNGDVLIKGAVADHNRALISKLEELGVTVVVQHDGIRVLGTSVLLPAQIMAAPYPGFPAELKAPMVILQLLANGVSTFVGQTDKAWSKYLKQLGQLNADIQVNGSTLSLNGPIMFHGMELPALNFQTGVGLVLAGLVAHGITQVINLQALDCAYRRLDQKLQHLGAQVDRVEIDDELKLPPDHVES